MTEILDNLQNNITEANKLPSGKIIAHDESYLHPNNLQKSLKLAKNYK